jgi:hypothetical protein
MSDELVAALCMLGVVGGIALLGTLLGALTGRLTYLCRASESEALLRT